MDVNNNKLDNSNTTRPYSAPEIQYNTSNGLGGKKPKGRKGIVGWIIALLAVVVIVVGGILGWFFYQLTPVESDSSDAKRVVIVNGSTPSQIADQLKSEDLIRSSKAFVIYARATGSLGALQAGTYQLKPSESTQQIIDHLKRGNVDTFSIQFLPGATLDQNKNVLKKAGYTDAEIDEAMKDTYSEFSDLFNGKPSSSDLEGYMYGETYTLSAGASARDVVAESLKLMDKKIKESNLAEGFKKQGLNLYEGITLASIIQREVTSPNPSEVNDDQRQVAQIFLLRLEKGMSLGSDVTYQYIADKLGIERDVNLDNPYNTRRFAGLPPGPISTPGLGALESVANPAEGDYLFFLSGDDDVTYFGRTEEEHNQNIKNHCAKKCLII